MKNGLTLIARTFNLAWVIMFMCDSVPAGKLLLLVLTLPNSKSVFLALLKSPTNLGQSHMNWNFPLLLEFTMSFTLASYAHTKALFPLHHSSFLLKLTSISPYWNPQLF
ncbi:hypothetical protein V8G54_008177 [Vigna mungo]|uniref:Uncharacterized protein n=1 Tax=Vigna mungo TaxID=3915 RepID=A0AAQ3P3B8_VIGMU